MPRKRKEPTTSEPRENALCVIYARVSSKEQEEGFSIDAQLGLLRGYALTKGLTVAGEYVEAETAKRAGRPQFGAMVAYLRGTQGASIVVEKTDRIYRNLKDRVVVGELIEANGLKLHLVKEGEVLHQRSPSHQKFVHDIKLVVAKNYIDNLSEEARKGMLEKARQGYWPSRAPIGYRNVVKGTKKIIEPDPVAAPLVRRLFEAYAGGEFSLSSAGRFAAAIGLTTSKGARLHSSSVHWILRNSIYVGKVVWDGQTFDGVHAPIVDVRTFDRAQAIMTGRNIDPTGGGHAKPQFAYRGLIRCGVCGCAMSPYVVKARYVYYACTGARGCPRKGIREEELTEQIAKTLEGLSIRPEVMDLLRSALQEADSEQHADLTERRAQLEARQRKLRDNLHRLYLDKVSGEVPADVYPTLRAQWESELDDVNRLLEATERANARTWRDNVAMLELVSNSADTFRKASSASRREMFKSLVSNSTVSDGTLKLNLHPWFETILQANMSSLGIPTGEDGMENWWAQLDSN